MLKWQYYWHMRLHSLYKLWRHRASYEMDTIKHLQMTQQLGKQCFAYMGRHKRLEKQSQVYPLFKSIHFQCRCKHTLYETCVQVPGSDHWSVSVWQQTAASTQAERSKPHPALANSRLPCSAMCRRTHTHVYNAAGIIDFFVDAINNKQTRRL